MSAETLTCTVDRVMYRRSPNPWSILRLREGYAKGCIEWEPVEGQRLRLHGQWKRSDRTGRMEFDFTLAELDLPEDPRAMLAYAVEITNGLGPAREAEIWTAYGAEWQQTSRGLAALCGLTVATREAWGMTLDRLESEAAKATAMAWMMAHGCTPRLAALAWEKWGPATQATVQVDCYCLASLPHYGFSLVDRDIRKHFGITDDDPRRADAALLYVLNRDADSNGNTAASAATLFAAMRELGIESGWEAAARLLAAKRLHELPGGMLAATDDFANEECIYRRLWPQQEKTPA